MSTYSDTPQRPRVRRNAGFKNYGDMQHDEEHLADMWNAYMEIFEEKTAPSMRKHLDGVSTSYDQSAKSSSNNHKVAVELCKVFQVLIRNISESGEVFRWALRNATVDAIDGVFARITFPSNCRFYLRGHVFVNPEEGYVHNHSAPFFSTCLYGGYTHKLWKIVPCDDQQHFRRTRKTGNIIGVPQKQTGALTEDFCMPFLESFTYFIGPSAFHTVHPKRTADLANNDDEIAGEHGADDGVGQTNATDEQEGPLISEEVQGQKTQGVDSLPDMDGQAATAANGQGTKEATGQADGAAAGIAKTKFDQQKFEQQIRNAPLVTVIGRDNTGSPSSVFILSEAEDDTRIPTVPPSPVTNLSSSLERAIKEKFQQSLYGLYPPNQSNSE